MSRFRPGDNVGPANYRWAGDAVKPDGGRQRARKLYPGPLACEVCGKKAERHHIDGNTRNNDRSNIAFLCNKHHKEADGRMTRPAFRAACSRKGMRLTDEHKAKISAAGVGRHVSGETRLKISQGKAAYYARVGHPTNCPQGHPYDEANTYIGKSGSVQCRACARARSLRNYHARKGAA